MKPNRELPANHAKRREWHGRKRAQAAQTGTENEQQRHEGAKGGRRTGELWAVGHVVRQCWQMEQHKKCPASRAGSPSIQANQSQSNGVKLNRCEKYAVGYNGRDGGTGRAGDGNWQKNKDKQG